MNVDLICTIAVAAIAVIYLIVGVSWGIKRGLARSLFRLLTIAAAAVISYFISIGLYQQFGGMIQAYLLTLVDQYVASLAELIHASETLLTYVLQIAIALLAPFLYATVFCILRVLLWILYAALCMFLPSRRKKPLDLLSRLTGVAVSIVGCAVIVVSLVMPYVGYLRLAAVILPKVEASTLLPEGTIPENVDTILGTVNENKAIRALDAMGCGALFDQISGSVLDIEGECDSLLALAEAVSKVAGIDFSAIFDETQSVDLSPVRVDLIDAVEGNENMKAALAELLSYAADKWQRGEEVLSINIKEQLPDGYRSALDAPLNKLANTTPETVCGDLCALADSIETISETYVYLHKVSHAGDGKADQETLIQDMENILTSLTPESAELVSEAIASTVRDDEQLQAQVGSENASAIASIMSDSLTGIAELPEEEKKKEAAAINNLISYTTDSRKDEVTSDALLDDILESSIIRNVVTEKSKPDEETGEEGTKITVTAEQKAEMDAAITAKEADPTLTDEERATLEALRSMFVVKAPTPTPTP